MNEAACPRVSVVIPWCNRSEIASTLRENCPLVHSAGGEIIVVNCGGDQSRLQELICESGVSGLRVVTLPVPSFNRTLALNLGAELSRSTYFLSLDSDVVLKHDALEQTMAAISDKPAFATVSWMHESDPQACNTTQFRVALAKFQTEYLCSMVNTINTQVTFSDGTSVAMSVMRENVFTGARHGSGQLLVRKADLLRVGGYNSELRGWGWEDLDILLRLRKHLQLEHLEAGEVFHLTHGDELRALNGKPKWATNLDNLCKSFSRYSKGDFLGTIEADRATWQNTIYEWAA